MVFDALIARGRRRSWFVPPYSSAALAGIRLRLQRARFFRTPRVASLLKRWLLGTHQGAVSHQHLAYYLDEFTFRFNRRNSKSRGKLFFRLMQQAVSTPPATYDAIVKRSKPATQSVGVC